MSGPDVAVRTLWNDDSYIDIRNLIRQHRPDILHCTNTFPLISPAVYYAARAENVPVVQSLHNYRLLCANGYLLRDGKPCEACGTPVEPLDKFCPACGTPNPDDQQSGAVAQPVPTRRASEAR